MKKRKGRIGSPYQSLRGGFVREHGLGIVKSDSPGGSRRQNGRRPRVGMLNSYNIPPGRAGRESMRVQGFLQALATEGWIEGRDFDFILLDIEERPAMHAAARALVEE